MDKPTVTFIPVETPQKKLSAVCQTVQNFFDQKRRLLISVPNQIVAEYIDTLLWKMPPESFLPHVVSETPCEDAVVITQQQSNLNQAEGLLNLCPTASAIAHHFQEVIELFDKTDPKKQQMAQARYATYQQRGYIT